MARVLERPATYEDLLTLPENKIGEIVGGELYVSPIPALRCSRTIGNILYWLLQAFDQGETGPGGWWIFRAIELHLGGDVLVPDLCGWRRERLPVLPDTPGMELAPDWICEVVSPETAALDRVTKLPRYARYGVEHAWIVDPAARFLQLLRLRNGFYSYIGGFAGEENARVEPFDAIELPLAKFWM